MAFALLLTKKTLAAAMFALAAGVGLASAESTVTPESPESPESPQAAHRVITLSPHATEMIYAAGAGDTLIATVTSSDFPEEARRLPRVGDGILLNQERIFMLRPTLLVGWLRSTAAMHIEPIANMLGAQMVYSRPLRLRDIPAEVRRLGGMLGRADSAAAAADAMQARIDALEARYAGLPPISVFIEVGSKPLYTIGDDPLLNDALRVCGAVNVYADTGIPAPRVSVESVLVKDPQLLIIAESRIGNAEEVLHRWAEYGLPAAKRGHIQAGDPDALYRPGPRLIDAMEALCPAVDAARSGSNSTTDAFTK